MKIVTRVMISFQNTHRIKILFTLNHNNSLFEDWSVKGAGPKYQATISDVNITLYIVHSIERKILPSVAQVSIWLALQERRIGKKGRCNLSRGLPETEFREQAAKCKNDRIHFFLNN